MCWRQLHQGWSIHHQLVDVPRNIWGQSSFRPTRLVSIFPNACVSMFSLSLASQQTIGLSLEVLHSLSSFPRLSLNLMWGHVMWPWCCIVASNLCCYSVPCFGRGCTHIKCLFALLYLLSGALLSIAPILICLFQMLSCQGILLGAQTSVFLLNVVS